MLWEAQTGGLWGFLAAGPAPGSVRDRGEWQSILLWPPHEHTGAHTCRHRAQLKVKTEWHQLVTCSSWLGPVHIRTARVPESSPLRKQTSHTMDLKGFASHREATPGYLRGGRGASRRLETWACPVRDKMITEAGQQGAAPSIPTQLSERLTFGHRQEPREGRNGPENLLLQAQHPAGGASSIPQRAWSGMEGGIRGSRSAHTAVLGPAYCQGEHCRWGTGNQWGLCPLHDPGYIIANLKVHPDV